REGSVWLGTDGGLDQFRVTKLTPVAWPHPVLMPAIAAGDGGTVWAGSKRGPMVAIGDRVALHPEVPAGIICAYRDLDGGVWLGGPAGLWHARGGPFARVALPVEAVRSDVQAIARSRDGALWLSVRGDAYRGILRRRDGVWERFGVPGDSARGSAVDLALVVVADSAGRLWLGYMQDRLALVTDDTVRVYSAADGLHVGTVTAVHVRGTRVWVGGETGVMVFDVAPGHAGRAPRFQPIVTAGGVLRGVTGIVETADGDLWLNGADGVVRVPSAEWQHGLRDPAYRARDERFDFHDGVDGPAPQVRPFPSLIAGTDGRLWFSTESGVAWVDPAHIQRNTMPPPVRIRTLDAGGQRYAAAGRVTLPPRTTALSIAYTALSLAAPDRVRFRYQLVGLDTAWQDVGTRREAIYTNLGPGSYRFRVIAANDDGVWNAAGAMLDVDIPPTFVQTRAFLALCAAAAAGALYLLVQWRHREAARALRAQYDAILAERMRVARELHDTLLSDVAGITMRLDAATHDATRQMGDVAWLADLRDQARRTLNDTRRAVGEMRTSSADLISLGAQLADAARRIFAGTDVRARVESTGRARGYPPAVEAELLRIATEA
ncbi:MAG TPA: triple tyrosine motif-containing protein, partial [Gemmatirosa sp.]